MHEKKRSTEQYVSQQTKSCCEENTGVSKVIALVEISSKTRHKNLCQKNL